MTLKLPHWGMILVSTLGVVVFGLAHLPSAAPYKIALFTLGGVLVQGGLTGALVLPSVSDAVQIASTAKLPNAAARVLAAVRQSAPTPKDKVNVIAEKP
jgi:hypothetical protein